MKFRPRAAVSGSGTLRFALFLATLLSTASMAAQASSQPVNQNQQLAYAGLRSSLAKGQFNAVRSDAAGNLYLLLDEGDGVRILKTDGSAATILAQILLGAAGDVGIALALSPAGNVYVTGTTTSAALTATPGAAIPTRTDTTTNSFLAAFDLSLNPIFVTFTGGSRIAASALAVTSDAIFVTGSLFSDGLPVTPGAFQQSAAPGSTQNGFVEKFSSDGTTLLYATYLTGDNGNTTPAAIAADPSNAAYIVGSTTSPAYPTASAIIPTILSNPSGFLTKLTPAGDAASFSTFIPGPGLTSIALDTTAQSLLISGTIASGQFPVETAAAPIAPLPYQSLLKLPLDASSVQSSILLAPGTQSFVSPDFRGGVWLAESLTAAILPLPTLASLGDTLALRITPQQTIDQSARFGGLPNANPSFASIPTVLTAIAVDPTGQPLIAGSIQPTASSSLLSTETYDLPLINALTEALPSTLRSAEATGAACTGSLCSGSAAYLAKLSLAPAAPSLAVSADDAPNIVLRNLGSAPATGLTITANDGTLTTNCPDPLASAAECNILLSGAGPATLTISAANTPPQSIPIPAFTPSASTIVISPKELDFGIQTSTSPPAFRTLTISNLGTSVQTFAAKPETTSPFTQSSNDCPQATDPTLNSLTPAATCHITLGFTASPDPTSDAYLQQHWQIGSRDILLTGYSQAASLSVSASEIDFGTQYPTGSRLPRFLHLSNASTLPSDHAPISLPASSPFTIADACPSMIPAQSVCTLRLDYLSTIIPSEDSTTLTLDQGLTVLITGRTFPSPGTGTLPSASLIASPSTITFLAPVAVTTVSAEMQTVTLTNPSPTAIPLTVSRTGDFLQQSTCPASLPAGQTCTVSLTFAPSQPGERLGLLTISSGPAFALTQIPITASATSIVSAENDTLNFGDTLIGQPITLFLPIKHPFAALTAAATGPYTVTLMPNLGFGPGNPTNFAHSITTACTNCYLAIRFTPTATGSQPGTLTLSAPAPANPYTITLTGSGLPAADLILTPPTRTLGTVPLSSTSPPFLFTLTNLTPSGATIILSPPVLTGDFALDSTPTGGPPCTGTLVYSASCLLYVTFTPTTIGARTGTLTLPTTAGSVSATLTGFATPDPGLALSPTALIFNNVPGPTSMQQSITLTNTATTNLQIAIPTLTNHAFTATSNCTTLVPAATCSIAVTFTPSQALASDTLTIPVTSATGTRTYPIPLTGAYTASSAALAITPDQVAFGPTSIATLALPRQYNIQNLTTQSLSLNLAIPRQFALINPPCTTLAPAASCTFTAQFIPLTNADTTGSIVAHATPTDGSAHFQTFSYLDGYGLSQLDPLTLTGPIQSGILNFGQVTSGQTGSATLTLANNNPTPITVRRITSPPPFLSTTTCGLTLNTGQTCTVTLNYAPTNQVPTGTPSPPSTPDIGLLSIESDASSSPDLINLTGQAGPVSFPTPTNNSPIATYTLSQGSLTFPFSAAGVASPSQTITLLNTGTTPIHLLSTSTTPDFSVQATCSNVLPAATCTITVTSIPQSSGTHIAALQLSSDSTSSLDFISLLSVPVTATPPTLSISPLSLDFGSILVTTSSTLPILVTTSSTLPIEVTNPGPGPVLFTSIFATGDYAPAGTCPAPNTSLPAGQTCTIQVTFAPTQIGLRPGLLTLTTNAAASPAAIPLSGLGIQSELTATPFSLDFGAIVLGASSQLALTLTNSDTAPVNNLALTPTGDYTVTTDCPTTLAPAATCSAQITFTPTALGPRTGTLAITSSDPSTPLTIPLTGIGTPTGTSPQNGSFTLTVNGDASATITVTSPSSATYSLAVTPTGGYTGLVALTCSPIDPGVYATCTIQPATVTLAGSQEAATATITTSDNTPVTRNRKNPYTLPLIFAATLIILTKPRRRIRVSFLTLLLATTACGSGVSKSIRYTPAGTYQYQVTAASTIGPTITKTVTLNLVVKSPF